MQSISSNACYYMYNFYYNITTAPLHNLLYIAMIGDSAAMIVDSMTYGFNLFAERKKNEEDVEDIHADEVEIEMPRQLDDDNDTEDIITTDNDSYNLERIRLRKRKKILHYELKVRVCIV